MACELTVINIFLKNCFWYRHNYNYKVCWQQNVLFFSLGCLTLVTNNYCFWWLLILRIIMFILICDDMSVVFFFFQTVYESLCLPYNEITDYVTEYSGITRQTLKGVTTRLEDIQRDLRELFPPDVILVGQSLGFDLHALKVHYCVFIYIQFFYNNSVP